jgi:hypothetical protein
VIVFIIIIIIIIIMLCGSVVVAVPISVECNFVVSTFRNLYRIVQVGVHISYRFDVLLVYSAVTPTTLPSVVNGRQITETESARSSAYSLLFVQVQVQVQYIRCIVYGLLS